MPRRVVVVFFPFFSSDCLFDYSDPEGKSVQREKQLGKGGGGD